MGKGASSSWYVSLNKAPWTPPGWVFGVTWTIIMICFSIYLSFLAGIKNDGLFWILFGAQFVLNILWNLIFFKLHFIGLGLFVLILLTTVIGYYIWNYHFIMKTKSLLIAPYFIWLLIATSLNSYTFLKN
jgi:tryptophan-rich sensory protein